MPSGRCLLSSGPELFRAKFLRNLGSSENPFLNPLRVRIEDRGRTARKRRTHKDSARGKRICALGVSSGMFGVENDCRGGHDVWRAVDGGDSAEQAGALARVGEDQD